MATTGTTRIAFTSYDDLVFSWETTSQSVVNNTSTVKWTLQIVSSTYGAITSSVRKNWAVNVNGTSYSGTASVAVGNNSRINIASGSTTIQHNKDGSKTFAYAFALGLNITFNNKYIGDVEGSGTGKLNDIPQAATIINATSFTDADNPTVTYSNPAGTSVSSLQACISITGSADDVEYRDIPKTGTSYTFTLTDAEKNVLYGAVTTGSSVDVFFYIKTVIGDRTEYRSKKVLFTISDSTPSISSITAIDVQSVTANATGNTGIWVNRYSNVQYTITASGKAGATISSYNVTCGSQKQTTATGTFNNVTSNTINVKVTDSRGNVATSSFTSSGWVNYIPVSLTGTTTLDGNNNLNIKFEGNYFNAKIGASDNALTLKYRYKTADGEFNDWTTVTPTISGNTYSYQTTLTAEYEKSYIVEAQVNDLVTITSGTSNPISAKTVFDWGHDDFSFNVPMYAPQIVLAGTNSNLWGVYSDYTAKPLIEVDTATNSLYVGLGGYADSVGSTNIVGNAVNVISKGDIQLLPGTDSNVKINGYAVSDFVIETGTESMGSNGTWYWRKWYSGRAEAYGCRNYGNMAVSTAWGGLYRSEAFNQDLPSIFAAIPDVIDVTIRGSTSHGGWICKHESYAPSAIKTGGFIVVRPASATMSQVFIGFSVIGRWK